MVVNNATGGLGLLDWLIIALYAGGTLALGYYYGRARTTLREYFTGSGRMNSTLIGFSLFATALSTGSYLAVPGEAIGSGPGLLNEPCDVITAPNGDIFVSDGHSGQKADPPAGTTGRIIKYNKAGEYITEWGRMGSGPGEFRTPHALAFDSQGRLFVADRGNNRIQIYDQDGNYIDSYYHVGEKSEWPCGVPRCPR